MRVFNPSISRQISELKVILAYRVSSRTAPELHSQRNPVLKKNERKIGRKKGRKKGAREGGKKKRKEGRRKNWLLKVDPVLAN